eukprot:jgi/Botrbrau1/992/Bobra.114_1s0031.2
MHSSYIDLKPSAAVNSIEGRTARRKKSTSIRGWDIMATRAERRELQHQQRAAKIKSQMTDTATTFILVGYSL